MHCWQGHCYRPAHRDGHSRCDSYHWDLWLHPNVETEFGHNPGQYQGGCVVACIMTKVNKTLLIDWSPFIPSALVVVTSSV